MRNSITRRTAFTGITTILMFFVGMGGASADPPTYSLTEIRVSWGTVQLGGATINNLGNVAGTALVGSGAEAKTRAFLWSYRTKIARQFGTLGGSSSSASGLNDCDEVVGAAQLKGDNVSHAVLFCHGGITDLDPHGAGSVAYSINNNGVAVGSYTVKSAFHPALFQHGTVTDLTGTIGEAVAISLSGTIVGTKGSGTRPFPDHAFVIQDYSLTDLNPNNEAISYASAVNDFGVWWARLLRSPLYPSYIRTVRFLTYPRFQIAISGSLPKALTTLVK